MARLRANFQRGTITDAPLLVAATAINSSQFATLPVVASPDTMVLSLDPRGVSGAPEIVIVTAHASGATSLTATRGAEGTTAREHAAATTWVHAPTAADFGFDTVVGVRKYAATIGNGTDTAITVTHNLGTRDVIVAVYTNSGMGGEVWPEVEHFSTDEITLTFSTAPTTNQYRVVIHA